MKVVVVIKKGLGGSGVSQAARYVSTRERDEAHEGQEARWLFSESEERLNYSQANRLLGDGRDPKTDDVLHLVISFHREEDFNQLGTNEEARLSGVRETTRGTLKEMADALNAEKLRWVAGIHRNTDNPHIHLLIHRDFADSETGDGKWLDHLPKDALPSRVVDENGREQVLPGSLSLALATALDQQQEKVRAEEREPKAARLLTPETSKEKEPSLEDRLLAIARRNPSSVGQSLTQEIILRGATSSSNERPHVTDLRTAFRSPGLDEAGYRTPPEHADWLAYV